jgi:hypothetical protein
MSKPWLHASSATTSLPHPKLLFKALQQDALLFNQDIVRQLNKETDAAIGVAHPHTSCKTVTHWHKKSLGELETGRIAQEAHPHLTINLRCIILIYSWPTPLMTFQETIQ